MQREYPLPTVAIGADLYYTYSWSRYCTCINGMTHLTMKWRTTHEPSPGPDKRSLGNNKLSDR